MISVAQGLLANNVSQITFRARDRRGRREKHAGGDGQGEDLHGQIMRFLGKYLSKEE